ncbi:MAG: DUF6690 family protein [Pirellula sp.]
MISNFIQKPFGAAAVLAAAIGGPYAAFETETGTSLRRSLFNAGSGLSSGGDQEQSNSSPSNESYSLHGSNGNLGAPWSSNGNSPYPAGSTYVNGASTPGVVHPAAMQTGMSGMPSVTVGMPDTYRYGASATPATPTMLGTGNPVSASMPSGILESRQGPASAIPGGTNQLWDYTLGVPTIQQLQQQPSSLGGGEVHDLREVLRFDIAPHWLPQRFSRVSTVLSNVQMDGLRVPLITGTRPTDLAGTLTYYFDASQSLRRINLHGLTGDPSQLATLMVQYYGLQPEQSLGGQLFTTRWNNRIANLLQIAPAPVIYAGADHSKYTVFLELNQASTNFGLSQEASDMLQNAQATRRW